MFHDKRYWEKYYTRKEKIDIGYDNPSGFALFVLDQLTESNNRIVELGCGNGRDSIFFAENNKNVLAIDQCKNTTDELNNIYKNMEAMSYDFTRLPINLEFKPNVIYSRFTLHSIDESGEDRTIAWAGKALEKGGLFCLEARTVLDPLCGKGDNKGRNTWFTDHYRRFIVAEEVINKFEDNGFEVIYKIEQNNLAIYKDDNPVVLRLICRKK